MGFHDTVLRQDLTAEFRLLVGECRDHIACGSPPERERPLRDRIVHAGRNCVARIGIVGLVLHLGRQVRMHGLPRCLGRCVQAQCSRGTCRIAQREVKTDQDAVSAPCQLCDDAIKESPRLEARIDVDGLVLQLEPGILCENPDPDGVLARHRFGRGTPVHHDIGIKQTRHNYPSLTSILPVLAPSNRPMNASGAFSIPSLMVSSYFI